MIARLDLTGERFGSLVALSPVSNPSSWTCLCDCGAEVKVLTTHLRRGRTLSCGCRRKQRANKPGERFGRLVLVSPARHPRSGRTGWTCRCDCGAELFVLTQEFSSGRESCVCLRTERVRAAVAQDLSGIRFGKLIAVTIDPEWSGRARKWICRCDCGSFTSVTTGSLNSGHTSSCGCAQSEKARAKRAVLNIENMTPGQIRAARLDLNGREKYTKEQVWERGGGLCGICGLEIATGSRWHIDHVIPVQKGGPDVLSNVLPAHPSCNSRKKDSYGDKAEWCEDCSIVAHPRADHDMDSA
jgi:hypothetical protein